MMEGAYLLTERAHYMCPDMHFGLLLGIRAAYDGEKLRRGFLALQRAHPFLKSVIADEERPRYALREGLSVPLWEKNDISAWQKDYGDLTSGGWDVRQECLLKAAAYPGESGFQILLIAHHLLCDGRGLLLLATELAEYYVNNIEPPEVTERLISSLDDLPPGSGLPLVSRVVIDGASRAWRREGHRVSYDTYAAFEREYSGKTSRRYEVSVTDSAGLEELRRKCREKGVTVNDLLIARLMLEENARKVVIAEDIRPKLGIYRKGALGNYSTAFSVKIKKPAADPFDLAAMAHRAVQRTRSNPSREMLVLSCYLRMAPELIDAAAISALGGFESKAGTFVGGRVFGFAEGKGIGLTNLGRIDCDLFSEGMFIPPASPANRVTRGVLTVNGKMTACTVYKTR